MSGTRDINELIVCLMNADEGLPPMTLCECTTEVLLISTRAPRLAAQFGKDPDGALWGPKQKC